MGCDVIASCAKAEKEREGHRNSAQIQWRALKQEKLTERGGMERRRNGGRKEEEGKGRNGESESFTGFLLGHYVFFL